MKALVVVGHPATASLNHAIASTIAGTWRACGCDVSFRDLQAEGFPPLLTPEEARGGSSPPAPSRSAKAGWTRPPFSRDGLSTWPAERRPGSQLRKPSFLRAPGPSYREFPWPRG